MKPIIRSHPWRLVLAPLVMLVLLLAACSPAATPTPTPQPTPTPTPEPQNPGGDADVAYTLETGMRDGQMVFIGVGGDIDDQVNPNLRADLGDTVEITLVIGDGVMHDLVIDEFDAATQQISAMGQSDTITFVADQEGAFDYYCSVPGHRQIGMEGAFTVGEGSVGGPTDAVSISRNPHDLPGPIGDRGPTTVQVEMEAVELEGVLADGTTYTYWTFDEQVPGPFIRVREGDTVEVTLRNRSDSQAVHSVDFHAVTGGHGGGEVTQIAPGEEATFTFKALNPGLYVYHCATPSVAHHIASGMYGMILVEPEGGLSEVDREFYVMQGELYTDQPHGAKGRLNHDHAKMLSEQPEYFVLNGSVDGLKTEHPLQANVGEEVRIYFGVGGPNFISSFHVIGEVFDRVYDQASLTSEPLTNVQTTLVPPGGATVVEFGLEVPGTYLLVDHALSRAERGLAGMMIVEGPENPEVFHTGPAQ